MMGENATNQTRVHTWGPGIFSPGGAFDDRNKLTPGFEGESPARRVGIWIGIFEEVGNLRMDECSIIVV
jgi:hypothetical protein